MSGWLAFLSGVGLFLCGAGVERALTTLSVRRGGRPGHAAHAIMPLQGQWFIANCECGYVERCASAAAAQGALGAHLRQARPWEHYAGTGPCPGPGDVTHRVLTHDEAAALVAGSGGEERMTSF